MLQIIDRVLQGEGIGWLRFNRLKKMMEEENNRTFALNYLSRTLRSRISKNGHVQDFVRILKLICLLGQDV
jgi:hypothetical protein